MNSKIDFFILTSEPISHRRLSFRRLNFVKSKFLEDSNKIEFAISANDKIEIFGERLEELIQTGLNAKDATIKIIEYASGIDSSISKKYELYEI